MKISIKKSLFLFLSISTAQTTEFTLLDSPKTLKFQNNKYMEVGTPTNYVSASNTISVYNPLEATYFYKIFQSKENVRLFLNHLLYPNATNTITDVTDSNDYENSPGHPLVYNYKIGNSSKEVVLSVTKDYESRIVEFYSRINDRKDPGTPIKYITFFTGENATTNSNGKNIGLFSTSLDLKRSSLEKIDTAFDEIILNVQEISGLNSESSIKICNKTVPLTATGLQWLKFLTIGYFQTPINGKYIISKIGLDQDIASTANLIKERSNYIEWNNTMAPGEYKMISTLYTKISPNTEGQLVDQINNNTKALLEDKNLKIPCVSTVGAKCDNIKTNLEKISGDIETITTEQITPLTEAVSGITNNLEKISALQSALSTNRENLTTIKSDINSISNLLSSIKNSLYGQTKNGEQATYISIFQQLETIRSILDGLNNGLTEFYSTLPVMNTLIEQYASISNTIGTLCYDDKSALSSKLNTIEDKTDTLNKTFKETQKLITDSNTGGILESMEKVSDACNTVTAADSEIMKKLDEILNRIDPGFALYHEVLPKINDLLKTFEIPTLNGFSDTNPIMASVIMTKLEVLLTKIKEYKDENAAIDLPAICEKIKSLLNPILGLYNITQITTSDINVIELRLQDLRTTVEQLKTENDGDTGAPPSDYEKVRGPLNEILDACELERIGTDITITPETIQSNLTNIKTKIIEFKGQTTNYNDIVTKLNSILDTFGIEQISTEEASITKDDINGKLDNMKNKHVEFVSQYNEIISHLEKLPLKTYDTPEEYEQILSNNPQLIYYIAARILAVDSGITYGDSNNQHELYFMTSKNKGSDDTSRHNRINVFYKAFEQELKNILNIKNTDESFNQNTRQNLIKNKFYNFVQSDFVKEKFSYTSYFDDFFSEIYFKNLSSITVSEDWSTINSAIENLKKRFYINTDTRNITDANTLEKEFNILLDNSNFFLLYIWARYAAAPRDETNKTTDDKKVYSEYQTLHDRNRYISGATQTNNWNIARQQVLINRLFVIKRAFNTEYFNNLNNDSINNFKTWINNLVTDPNNVKIKKLLSHDDVIKFSTDEYWTNKYHATGLEEFINQIPDNQT